MTRVHDQGSRVRINNVVVARPAPSHASTAVVNPDEVTDVTGYRTFRRFMRRRGVQPSTGRPPATAGERIRSVDGIPARH